MATLKCKMCGGDLQIAEGMTVAECEYCGYTQTIPTVDNEKKLTLFSRANRLRFGCEFDKAASVYEALVADFPEEAEAYWGLVLCKYGIEYVDDPATGKKIPTCHRSSFESVMDDSNLEQALENADVVARKLYREEAKQIETLRKGIIEVSGKEEPYDIFICYKETDETGSRTLDSVLAQDAYDALITKGYRVFFSRITLEDKLGQEYEPYIFAALNSAKIMLAFGTDYEHFNAVWVKTEWSRYLQIMTQDKSKHLIPCYKGIDAYDMPKEFAKLQAQDMGKIGAIQDLLRGIEKLLPKKEEKAQVVQQVVQQVVASGGPNVLALLKRGNLALEDREWVSATNFFDQVLNMDAECAEAYLGKALVQFKVSSLDGLVRKLDASQYSVGSISLLAGSPDKEAEDKIVRIYALPVYLEENDIRGALKYSFAYSSQHRKWEEKKLDILGPLYENRDLGRAVKYAEEHLQNSILSAEEQIAKSFEQKEAEAEAADTANASALMAGYEKLLKEHAKVKELRIEADKNREADYNKAEQLFGNGDYAQARSLYNRCYQSNHDYRDTVFMIEECNRLIAEQRAAEEAEAARKAAEAKAEAERREAIRKKEEAARAAKKKKITIITVTVCTAVITIFLLVTKVIIPGNQYKEAEVLLAAGQYEEAIAAFEALGDYKDSVQQIEECRLAMLDEKYADAESLVTAQQYDKAITAFKTLGDYRDSAQRIEECKRIIYENEHSTAESLLANGQYDEAASMFAKLGCDQDVSRVKYAKAESLLVSGDKAHAAMAFYEVKGYKDASKQSMEIWDEIAQRNTFAVGAAILSNGKVITKYDKYEVSGWKNIVDISHGNGQLIGLMDSGKVLATGSNESGRCNVSKWSDIVAVSAGDSHTVGLRADGTVVATGSDKYGECDVSGWSDIVAVSAGRSYTIGLKFDGTVLAAGYNKNGQCNVSGWSDIVAISAGELHTVGLRSDGTVVATGYNMRGECDVSGWRDIVAISTGYHTVGLRSDGTVVATGFNDDGQCNVSGWRNIIAIHASSTFTLGLHSNGSAVAVGYNNFNRNVSDWRDIKLPDA